MKTATCLCETVRTELRNVKRWATGRPPIYAETARDQGWIIALPSTAFQMK